MSNQQQQPKFSAHVTANFLQKIVCCNHNIANGPADTPRAVVADAAKKFFAEPAVEPAEELAGEPAGEHAGEPAGETTPVDIPPV